MTTPGVATVAGRPIPRAALDAREAALRAGSRGRHLPPPGNPAVAEARRWIVRELVTEALIARELEARSLTDVAALVEDVTADVVVDEADVVGYYTRNPDRFNRPETRMVRLVAVAGPEASTATASRLGDAAPIAIRRGELTGMEDPIFAARPGEIVGPMTIGGRAWVARVDEVVPAGRTGLEDARPEIESELLAAARTRAFDVWLEERRAALAHVERDFDHPGDPASGAPGHRH